MIVVSDTSPLNYLILVGCIDVLPQVFGQVYVPSSVIIELGHPRSPEPVRTWGRPNSRVTSRHLDSSEWQAGIHIEFEAAVWVDVLPDQRSQSAEISGG